MVSRIIKRHNPIFLLKNFILAPKDVDNNSDLDLTPAERNSLLYNPDGSDVKFIFNVVSDSLCVEEFIWAHKRILSNGSCVFYTMFNGFMAEAAASSDPLSDSHTPVPVSIPDISIECFRNILMFIYIGDVKLNMDNILEVMYAAQKYQVCKLESLCCDFLYKNMDISNVFEIYELTLKFNNDITKMSLQWIADLFDDLTKGKSFLKVKKSTLMELLKLDTLNISEMELFKAVYKWAENYCTESSVQPSDENLRSAADNFSSIRFPTMNLCQFSECAQYGQNILTPDEKLDVWDALSNVKSSVRFNSKKRIRSATAFRAFDFCISPAKYVEHGRYSFEFKVRRITHLNTIRVIRNCCFAILEKEVGETNFTKGFECLIHLNESKHIRYVFVPNVTYALVTVDNYHGCGFKHNNPGNFTSYDKMQKFFNCITKLNVWSSVVHDPFVFVAPQRSLIKLISYRTSE